MTQSLKDKLVILFLAAIGAAFMVTFIAIEDQAEIFALILFAAIAIFATAKLGGMAAISQSVARNEKLMNAAVIAALLVVVFWFREDHFPLLMIATVLVYIVACFGLNMQFGYTGVVNFAGAAFFGVGSYTAAVLGGTSVPLLLVIALGGVVAAIIGSILIIPVLRTRGHYAAVVTIAFGLLFSVPESLTGTAQFLYVTACLVVLRVSLSLVSESTCTSTARSC